jgi:hypothetical protein
MLQRNMRIATMVKNLSGRSWFRVSPIFFMGTIVTAAGTTVYKNDKAIFAGMILMGLGVISMWVAENGKFKWKSIPGPLVFMLGSILTAMSMTIIPSNPLLCAGMILTGLGTMVMWLIAKESWTINGILVGLLFMAGITLEAVSLTVFPSDVMIMIGMIATGFGAFAMWAFDLSEDKDEEKGSEKE